MKTSPILIAGFSAFALVACSEADRTTVTRKRYPNSEVAKVPDHASKYVRRDADGSVWIFETKLMGSKEDPYVSQEFQLFPSTKPAVEAP